MALIKDQIVEAARELNRELGLEPRINTRQEIDLIKELLLEAADLITEEDDISEKTMNVIEELRMEMDQEENELEDEDDVESGYPEWIPAPEDVDEATSIAISALEEEEEEPAPKKQKPGRATKKSIVEDSLEEGATILEMAERIVAAGIDANLEKNIKTVKLWLRKMGFDTKKEFIETNPVFKNSMKREGN